MWQILRGNIFLAFTGANFIYEPISNYIKKRPLNEYGVGLFERVVRNGRILLIETWIYNEEILLFDCIIIGYSSVQ